MEGVTSGKRGGGSLLRVVVRVTMCLNNRSGWRGGWVIGGGFYKGGLVMEPPIGCVDGNVVYLGLGLDSPL